MTNKQKPILPNGYKITDEEIIEQRIAVKNGIEIYILENENYLYLLLGINNLTECKKQKFNIQFLKIGKKDYQYFVSESNYLNSINDLVDNLTTLKGFDAVAGMKELKKQLFQDIICPIKDKDRFEKFKLTIPNGILLYGPPGCGKTFIVRRLAEELNFVYYEIKHSDVTTPYIHGGVGKIANVFNEAKRNAPAIIFIDELDGMVPNRLNLDSAQSHKLEEVNEFLSHLNDAGKNNILVIGATNQPELIDKAILRSGRFDKKIYVMPPDFDARRHLFEMYLDGRPLTNIDYDTLAGQTINYSSSDIEFICNEAARQAVANNLNYIDEELLLKTIKMTSSSIQ